MSGGRYPATPLRTPPAIERPPPPGRHASSPPGWYTFRPAKLVHFSPFKLVQFWTVDDRGGIGEILGAAVGQLAPLDVPPQRLGGIQLRGVPRQPLDPQPVSLRVQGVANQGTFVRRQLVPDQDDAPAADVAGQGRQIGHHAMPVAASRKRPKPHLRASTIPAKPERQADQQFLPVEPVDQDRGLAPRRPGPADRWPLGDAALVVEENPGLPASGVFFTAGQRWDTQCRIAAAFRSRACVAGRCSVQSSARRTRHT